VASLETFSKRIFPLISQIGINYRNASLSQHTADERENVKAGDRLPYFEVDGRSIFEKLKQPKFHMLMFSRSNPEDFCEDFSSWYGHLADCNVIPLSAKVSELFETEEDFCVFLRPDNQIAFISSDMSPRAVGAYLQSRHIS